MKQFLWSLHFFFVFFLTTPTLLAFQELPSVVKKYGSLEKAVTATEELAYAGEFAAAIELGERIKAIYQKQNDVERLCFMNRELLLFEVIREDLDAAQKEAEIQRFHKKSKENNEPNIDQICQAALAHLMVFSGQLARFEKYYKRAAQLAKQQEDYTTLHNLNVNIATEYLFLTEWQPAQIYLERAEKALSKERVSLTATELGSFHNARSVIYYNLSEYDKALSSALYNVHTLENSKEDETIALLYDYNNLAGIYNGLGEEENALIYHKKALDLLPNVDADYPLIEQAVLYYNTAIAYDDNHEIDKAIFYATKALNILSKLEDQGQINYTLGICYIFLTNAYSNKEMIDSSEHYIQKTEKLLSTSPILLTDYYHAKCRIESTSTKKNYKKAIFYANKGLLQTIKDYGQKDTRMNNSYYPLIQTYNKINKPDTALYYSQKALEALSINFSDPKGYTNPKIKDIIHKQFAINILSEKIKSLRALYNKEKNTAIAQAIFATTRLSTEVLEQLSKEFKNPTTKRRWLQNQAIPLFETAIASALEVANTTNDPKYLQEAFELSERSKSMLMTDMLQEQQAAAAGGVPDSLVNQLQNLKRALYVAKKKRFDAITNQEMRAQKQAEDRIFELDQELNVLKRYLEKNHTKYYNLKYDNKHISLEELQAVLEPNSMLLEYFEGDSNTYIFSVYKDHLEVASFKRDKTYKHLFKRFSTSLMEIQKFIDQPIQVYNDFVKDGHQLYQYLIQPVNLKGIERIIIIPDGELSYLPFEVLLSKKVPLIENKKAVIKANFSKLPYLLHDFSTNYNYSGRLWLERNALSKKAVNNRILALAPAYGGVELPEWRGQREVDLRKKLIDLPGALDEVEHLKKHYGGEFYSGYEANEALLKKEAANYGILHLAMHGLVNTKKPEFSGLALAEDKNKNEDNFLYAYEIEQLPLNTSLIVLSACETGIGQYQRGEGVVSIGRSFVYAGAPSLLMTLWNLNDQSGAIIIEEFYKNLNQGLEKDEAIRQAKLFYLKTYPQEYAHPFLWAPFIQVGSYEAISIASKGNTWLYTLLGIAIISLMFILFYTTRKKTH